MIVSGKKLILLLMIILVLQQLFFLILTTTVDLTTTTTMLSTATTAPGNIPKLPSYQYSPNATIQLPLFQTIENNNAALNAKHKLPRRIFWDERTAGMLTREYLRSNLCLQENYNRHHCMTSIYIAGFEKCGTTALNLWLSYHPNLKSNWLESRYFDSNKPEQLLASKEIAWRSYLKSLPTPSSSWWTSAFLSSQRKERRQQKWIMEKSPAYATNPYAPQLLQVWNPNAQVVMMVRNPTDRAYSMFCMYLHHYPDVMSVVWTGAQSYFVKHQKSGVVRMVTDGFEKYPVIPPGRGGAVYSIKGSKDGSTSSEEWEYISYPPSPQDFHAFVQHAIRHENRQKHLFVSARDRRLLYGGLYSTYIQHWVQFVPPENLLVIFYEEFFGNKNNNRTAIDSMNHLQDWWELPYKFDYTRIATESNGRYDIPDSLATRVNNAFSHLHSPPMLPETRQLLNDYYCRTNRELSQMLNRALPSSYHVC